VQGTATPRDGADAIKEGVWMTTVKKQTRRVELARVREQAVVRFRSTLVASGLWREGLVAMGRWKRRR
jgi:hypothetical protein